MINNKQLGMLGKYDRIIVIILWLFLMEAVQCLDYTADHTPNCQILQKLEQSNKYSLVWNILILHQIDLYLFLSLCPIIFIIQCVILYTYAKNQSLLIKPGNIFCSLIIIELVLNLSLFINGIYNTIFSDTQPMPPSFPGFCNGISVIFVFFEINHFLYLSMFLIFTIVNFRFSLRKRPKNFWKMMHLLVLLIGLGLTLLLYFDNFTGLSYYGICELTLVQQPNWNTIMPYFSIGISLLFASGGMFTLIYFKRHIPKTQTFERRKNSQHRTISLIVIGFSIFMLILSLIQLILDLNCVSQPPNTAVSALITFANFSRLCQYVFLIFIIIRNGLFRSKLKKTLKRIFQRNDNMKFVEKEFQENNFEYQQLAFNQRLLTLKEKSYQIDLLLSSQIYTIITGIYIAHYEYHHQNMVMPELKSIHYKQKVSFIMTNSSAMNYETETRVLLRLKILKCSVQLHAPRVFHRILQNDGLTSVYKSFEIVENAKKMWSSLEGRGGKSGEFFYFTADNRFVLKTITIDQFQFLLQNLESFADYYMRNPDSLLAKIYGVFTIKGDQIQRTFRIILMKNILGCPKTQVMRIYDMKGSKHDRQVIKKASQLEDAHKMTLKDTDFINYEGQILVSEAQTIKIRNVIHRDSQFLMSHNLIDYSLLVVKVKWQRPPKDIEFWSVLQRIKHFENHEQFYHIGVIDYMQKWDLQKKSEKWWKNFLGKKNISAADPNSYRNRFQLFVDQITVPPRFIELTQIKKQNQMTEQKGKQKLIEKNQGLELVRMDAEKSQIKKFQKSITDEIKPLKVTRDSSDLRLSAPDTHDKKINSHKK